MADSKRIDQEMGEKLLIEGGTLIFLDVPPKTEFGIDYNSWNVGEKFKGVKMIPPGIHFIYYSAVSKDNQTGPRTGFFHSFKRGEVIVKKWDKYLEDIKDEELTDEELDRFRQNLRDLDQHLGAYPYDSWKKWIAQTSYITDSILERLEPLNKKISSASHLVLDDSQPNDEGTSKRHKVEDDFLPKMRIKPGTEIRFTKIPIKSYPDGSTPAEITRHSLDRTYILESILSKYSNPEEILGDLQMAFVCFLIGQVYDAFEEWKIILSLLCNCDEAIAKHSEIYSKLIFILFNQVKEIPPDFFVDIVSQQNYLTQTLSTLFANLSTNEQVDKELNEKGKRFKKYLTKTFKWDFERGYEDDQPTIVEI